jgi:hypothetical protein
MNMDQFFSAIDQLIKEKILTLNEKDK